jgi:hypothetical protein
MAINIGSSTSSTHLQQTQQQNQTRETSKAAEDAAKAQQQAKHAQPAKQEQPKPVVNAQGQTTGKVINIMA